MLNWLSDRFGVQGNALEWVHSSLLDCEQFVYTNEKSSRKLPLFQGVPQGSVLDPFLFCTYLTLIWEIFCHHGVGYQIYADELNAAISKFQLCARDIVNLMVEK